MGYLFPYTKGFLLYELKWFEKKTNRTVLNRNRTESNEPWIIPALIMMLLTYWLLIFIYSMMGLLINKYEPFWREVGVKSLILRYLRPVGLLLTCLYIHSCECLSLFIARKCFQVGSGLVHWPLFVHKV